MHPYRTPPPSDEPAAGTSHEIRLAFAVLGLVSVVQIATAAAASGVALGATCLAASTIGLVRTAVRTVS